MAGFEVIVRPVVFPSIRPSPPRVLAPEDNPEQGIAVISGSGGRLVDLPHNWSINISRNMPQKETRRQFDEERIFQVTDDGKINKENYVDVERLKKVRLDKEDGPEKVIYDDPPPRENVEIKHKDQTRYTFGAGSKYIYSNPDAPED